MFLPVTFSSHCICGCVGKSRFRWWEEDRNHLFPWAEPALPMLKQSLCQTFRPWTNSFDEIYLGLVIVTATILATNSAATELLISNYSSKDTSHCPNPPQPLHKERLKVSKRSLNVVSDHLLTITYHLRPCPDHTTSPGELWGQQVYPANHVTSEVPVLRATTASKQFTRHAGANPRPQASSSSNDAPTKRNQPDTPNTSRPLRGSTGLREHNTRKTRKQGRTQPHKSGTPGDHTYSDPHQSRVIHHTSNNTPIPSTHLIPVSFESLRRRRWRRRRRRRNSGTL